MVQLISDPTTGHTATTVVEQPTSSSTEPISSQSLWSSPSPNQKQRTRRGYSLAEYTHQPPSHHLFLTASSSSSSHSPAAPSAIHTASSGQVSTQAAIPENAVLPTQPTPRTNLPIRQQHPHKPAAKKPPRRSYSATDKEPEIPTNIGLPQPSVHLDILDMPPELHYTLFDFLDPIDAVCLGLAHSKLYGIYRRKHAAKKVPLSSRYSGPNDMEWAWRGARQSSSAASLSSKNSYDTQQEQPPSPAALEKLRVKGQVYCRKCGVSRCELHRHLKSWMGQGYEYCEIKQRFGKPAGRDAKEYCFMSSPKDRHRCGRHGGGSGVKNITTAAAAAATPTTAPAPAATATTAVAA
jgi:hypothetical protein